MWFFALHVPTWLGTTAKSGSLIAAWAGLFFGLVGTILALRRECLERIRLTFRFKATFIEEDAPNSDVRLEIDGVPSVEAIIVTVTNLGKGVTVEQCRSEYEASFHDGIRILETTAHVGQHIEKGKACEGRLKIYSKPLRFKSVVATDSTGRSRPCSGRELAQLNAEAEAWWEKTHFQKARNSTDAKFNERRRELQRERIQAKSLAARQAAAKRERETNQRRKLYNLMRRIGCINCEFQFPPGPYGATFNVTTIRQINHDMECIHDGVMELANLPEAKTVLERRVPCPADPNPSWAELRDIYDKNFRPIQTTFSRLEQEVIGGSSD